jgi:hypothetical protein
VSSIVVIAPDELAALVRQAVAEALTPATVSAPLYLKVSDFAMRLAVSERHAWDLVKQGLPTIGQGRGRRVDVVEADRWLRTRHDEVDVATEKDARRRARAAAAKKGGT